MYIYTIFYFQLFIHIPVNIILKSRYMPVIKNFMINHAKMFCHKKY